MRCIEPNGQFEHAKQKQQQQNHPILTWACQFLMCAIELWKLYNGTDHANGRIHEFSTEIGYLIISHVRVCVCVRTSAIISYATIKIDRLSIPLRRKTLSQFDFLESSFANCLQRRDLKKIEELSFHCINRFQCTQNESRTEHKVWSHITRYIKPRLDIYRWIDYISAIVWHIHIERGAHSSKY